MSILVCVMCVCLFPYACRVSFRVCRSPLMLGNMSHESAKTQISLCTLRFTTIRVLVQGSFVWRSILAVTRLLGNHLFRRKFERLWLPQGVGCISWGFLIHIWICLVIHVWMGLVILIQPAKNTEYLYTYSHTNLKIECIPVIGQLQCPVIGLLFLFTNYYSSITQPSCSEKQHIVCGPLQFWCSEIALESAAPHKTCPANPRRNISGVTTTTFNATSRYPAEFLLAW